MMIPKILECDIDGCERMGICMVYPKHIKRKYKYLPMLFGRRFLQLCVEHLEMVIGTIVKKEYGKEKK